MSLAGVISQEEWQSLEFVSAKSAEIRASKPARCIVIKNSLKPKSNESSCAVKETRKPDVSLVKTFPYKGSPLGLGNRGVTCYMNAAIQALVHIPAVAHYLSEVKGGKWPQVPSGSVTVDLANLYHKMNQGGGRAVYPSRLIRRLEDINCMMSEWQQEDSHEYLMSLISRLQEDSVPRGQKLNTSILHKIFGGAIKQSVTCKSCGHISKTCQEFSDLSVSFASSERKKKTGYTLQRSLREFFSPELIRVENSSAVGVSKDSLDSDTERSGYQCEKCKSVTNVMKVSRIIDPPEYLGIHLKRFKFQGASSHKLKEPLTYSHELDLSQYVDDEVKDTVNPLQYRLISVVVHEGRGVSSGHYVAFCHQPNGNWSEYDDEMFRRVSLREVLEQKSAYILVFAKVDPSSPIRKEASPGHVHPRNAISPSRHMKHDRSLSEDIDRIFDKRHKN